MPRYSSVSTDVESSFPVSSSPALIHEGPPVQLVAELPDHQIPATEPEQQSKRPSSERRKSKKLTKKPPLGRELPPENPSFKGPTDLEPDNIDNTINNDWPLSEPLPQEPESIRSSARSRTRASYHYQPRNSADKWDPSRHSLHNPTYNYNYNYSFTPPEAEADNFEDVANGELSRAAMATTDDNVHDRGVEPLRINTTYAVQDAEHGEPSASDPLADERRNSATQLDRLMSPAHSVKRLSTHSNTTRNSLMPLTQDSASMGLASPTPSRSPSVAVSYFQNDTYSEAPNHRYSRNLDPSLITFDRFDPDSIADDGDYGLHYPAQSRSKRASLLSFHSNRGSAVSLSPSAVGGATPPKSAHASTDNHGVYTAPSEEGAEGVQTTAYTGLENYDEEKQAWEKQEVRSNKRKMWILAIIIFLLVVGGSVGGIVGEYYVKKG